MKFAVLFVLIGLFAAGLSAQKQTSFRKPAAAAVRSTPKPTTTPKPKTRPLLSEAEEYKIASEKELAAERIEALKKFLENFPKTEKKTDARELISSSRVLLAEEKLLSGNADGAATLYRQAIEEAPENASKEFFGETFAKIPTTLYFRGARKQAFEIASALEKRAATNAADLIQIADFYLTIEDADGALRMAKAAEAVEPTSGAVQKTIAVAHRMSFDLEEAAKAFAKALELDPNSIEAKRGLADMQRAVGKSAEALALYRELLEKDEKNPSARTGYVLTLFETGKRAEAEAELGKVLEAMPGNVILMAGAAYWYASQGLGEKAVDLAKKAIDRDPRYIWSHIALAHGMMAQRKPVDAEQVLVQARKYGNFPTLEYEIASARLQAGFYRDAVDELRKSFSVADGNVTTKLGGRVSRSGNDLAELIAGERRASVLAATAAEPPDIAVQLKNLLAFDTVVAAAQPDEAAAARAADDFIQSGPGMKIHRQLYAASVLLQKRVAISKVAELASAALDSADSAFDAPDATAAILASELYEPRATAFSRSDFLLVPDVPKQTLSSIVRGRIEELAGWALYQQDKYPDAEVRLRRAVSVMPDKSAWWRSSVWKLGAALAAQGKDKEALDRYVQSYKTDRPDFAKYVTIEALYKKINGNTDGVDTLVGPERIVAAGGLQPAVSAPVPGTPAPTPEATPVVTAPDEPTKQEPATVIPGSVPVVTVRTDPSGTTVQTKTEPARIIETPARAGPEPMTEKTTSVVEKKMEPPIEKPVEKAVGNPTITEPTPATFEKVEEKPAEQKEPAVEPSKPDTEKTTDRSPPKLVVVTDDLNVAKTSEIKPKTKADPTEQTLKPRDATKPLFEPLIITIPAHATKESPTETSEVAKSDEKPVADQSADRPRVIPGVEPAPSRIEPCTVMVSQEKISIPRGKTVAMIVWLEGPGNIADVSGAASSPADIRVTSETEIAGMAGKRLFMLKSVAELSGVFQVTFQAPCGKKEVVVTIK